MVDSDLFWIHYGIRSKSYIIFNIGLPSYEWHIIPAFPMSANQSINNAIPPDHQITSYLKSQSISVRLNIWASCNILNHRLFRLAVISRYHPISQIAVYVGLPNISASSHISESSLMSASQKSRHHPSISPSIMVSTSTLDHRLSRFVMYTGKAGRPHGCDASKNLAVMPAKTWWTPHPRNQHSACRRYVKETLPRLALCQNNPSRLYVGSALAADI